MEEEQEHKSRLKKGLRVALKVLLPLVISLGLCWVLFHNDNLEDIWNAARTQCDFRWIAAMLVLSLLSNFFRALRWQIQLSGAGVPTPFAPCLYGIFGTYATNLVFPRLGEVWRCGYVAERQGASFATVFGTMIADRFADFITGFLFILATFIAGREALVRFFTKYPDAINFMERVVTSPWAWGALVILVVATVLFLKYRSGGGFIRKVQDFVHNLWGGFASILSMPRKGWWLLWTVGLWGCYFIEMYLAFRAFPFTTEILNEYGWTAVLVTFTLSTVAMGVPAQGGIGPYQVAVIFGLGLFMQSGLDADAIKAFEIDSKAFANLVLGVTTLLVILLGLWAFGAIALSNRRRRPRG